MNMDNYLNSYLDRRMKLMIDEWDLASKSDIKELSRRYHMVKDEVESLKTFERESQDRMDTLETRIRNIKRCMG
jgi:hypothetical protein